MNARLRHVLVSTIIVVGLLVLVGATYQGVATALERRKYPHPGRLIDVGGHQLHIHCIGEGVPLVVLEAPAAGMSAVWGWIQPDVAKATRVCVYDRAGLGWSEAGDRPYDPGRVPEELYALLMAARERGPYILAGHSLGASFVRRFAGLYPAETVGLVLIESPGDGAQDSRVFSMSPWLARAGLLRATGLLSKRWEGLPASSAGAVNTFLNRPDHLTRAAREVTRWDDAVELGAGAQLAPGLSVANVQADLNDEDTARRVTTAIVDTVARARSGERTRDRERR